MDKAAAAFKLLDVDGDGKVRSVLCEVTGEPIKQSTESIGKPITGRVKRALRKALGAIRARQAVNMKRTDR